MMAFAAWRRRTTLTAAPRDSPRRWLRVGDPCTIDHGESATAAAGIARHDRMVEGEDGSVARWFGGCRACELLRILWPAGLCTRLACLGLGAVWCFPGEGAEGSWLCHPSLRDVPRTSGRCRSRGPSRRGLRGCGVSGAPGSPEPEAGISKISRALIEACGGFFFSCREGVCVVAVKPQLSVNVQRNGRASAGIQQLHLFQVLSRRL